MACMLIKSNGSVSSVNYFGQIVLTMSNDSVPYDKAVYEQWNKRKAEEAVV